MDRSFPFRSDDGQLFKNFCCFFYRILIIMYKRTHHWAIFCARWVSVLHQYISF